MHKHTWKIIGERLAEQHLFIQLKCQDTECNTLQTELIRR